MRSRLTLRAFRCPRAWPSRISTRRSAYFGITAATAVVFQGSINESATAWLYNFESFSVFRSWDATAGYFDLWVGKFEERWEGTVPGFKVFPLPEAVKSELLRYSPDGAAAGQGHRGTRAASR